MKFSVLYHLAFWCFFTFLFLFQNPDGNINELLSWFFILANCATAVYVNLYILLPKLFFRKKYFTYSLILVITLILAASILTWYLPFGNFLSVPFFQHFLNLIFFIIITSSLKFLREYLIKQETLIKVENKQLKTELDLLKSQVNHHFLFNTLNNLYGLIVQNQNEKAADITLRLSDLMRYLLENSKAEKVNLLKELKFLEDYLELEKIRLSQKADILFDVVGTDREVFVAPLLFIPIVENAFKHGLQSTSSTSYAYFSLSLQGKDLYFESKNSFENKSIKPGHSGTGLDNLKKRLELIYPERHQLEIEKTESYFKVILHLQL
jgi:sensor histidine kinase YesM